MKNLFAVIGLVLCVVAFASSSTEIVTQCEGANFSNLQEAVTISNCSKKYCRLRKGTKAAIEMKFTPDEEVKTLTNSVFANIVSIPFPFIGVDGTDACSNVFSTDGKTKVGCPLKAGQEYLYKNSFDILEIYPRIKVVVHWALKMNDDKDAICFEVPARITN